MISPSTTDVISANVNGYELKTVDDFWAILAGTEDHYIRVGDKDGVMSARVSSERFILLLEAVPGARYVLWERDGAFLVVSPTLESLRSEFPWLKYTRLVR